MTNQNFVEKKVKTSDDETTVFGCDTKCCKNCPRKKPNQTSNSSKLTKKDFLKFLKRQRQKNTAEGILPPITDEPIPDAKNHNNANANHDNLNTVP